MNFYKQVNQVSLITWDKHSQWGGAISGDLALNKGLGPTYMYMTVNVCMYVISKVGLQSLESGGS